MNKNNSFKKNFPWALMAFFAVVVTIIALAPSPSTLKTSTTPQSDTQLNPLCDMSDYLSTLLQVELPCSSAHFNFSMDFANADRIFIAGWDASISCQS